VTLEQVDRALRELTNGEVNKLAAGDETSALAIDVLKAATKAKALKRADAADCLLGWIMLAGCTSGKQARAFTLYALAGYSSLTDEDPVEPEETEILDPGRRRKAEARLREDVVRYESDLRALADS
jgi:hypothetical protein